MLFTNTLLLFLIFLRYDFLMVFRDPEDGSKPASEAEISEAAGIFTPMANLMSGAAAAIGVADGQVCVVGGCRRNEMPGDRECLVYV
jgi:hypothetical protein